LNSECQKLNAALYFPDIHLCTDNGAMIALAAAMRLQAKVAHCMEPGRFEVTPRWPLSL
jgi:N6-L-threonylcarbamoyladenine synthase